MRDLESVASDPHGYVRAFVRLGAAVMLTLGVALVALGTRQR